MTSTRPLGLDLRTSPLLAPLPRALLGGRCRPLLSPLMFEPLPDVLHSLPGASVVPRSAVAAALEARNRGLGHPRASELCERLADPGTMVVATGQQSGLLGGPLYTLSKAVAATKVAQAIAAAGRPAVAVFWIATEDHDFDEVASATLGAVPGTVTLEPGEASPLVPVGPRPLGADISRLLGELCPDSSPPRYRAWVDELGQIYRPDASLGQAFAHLLLRLLGERAPLLLDALDPAIKRLEQPCLERLVERRHEVAVAVGEASSRVEAAGFRPQVKLRPGASPLFLLHEGERRCIEWVGSDRFRLRGAGDPSPVGVLEEIVATEPDRLSPGVLARPAIQDSLLGTSLQLLGPGELAYMAQAASLYPVLEVEPPAVTLRPQLIVVDTRESERLAELLELGVELEHLLGPRTDLDRRLAACLGANFVAPVAEQIDGLLSTLEAPARELEPQLETLLEKTGEQVRRSLERFSAKVAAAAARRDEVLARRIEKLRESLLPGGRLQERVIATAHFPGRFGDRFVEALFAGLELDSSRLQVVAIEPPPQEKQAGS